MLLRAMSRWKSIGNSGKPEKVYAFEGNEEVDKHYVHIMV